MPRICGIKPFHFNIGDHTWQWTHKVFEDANKFKQNLFSFSMCKHKHLILFIFCNKPVYIYISTVYKIQNNGNSEYREHFYWDSTFRPKLKSSSGMLMKWHYSVYIYRIFWVIKRTAHIGQNESLKTFLAAYNMHCHITRTVTKGGINSSVVFLLVKYSVWLKSLQ